MVCVPKTIDNDVEGTQRTFGFDTAVSTATEAIDKLHSTAESHERVMVVELMGRNAGLDRAPQRDLRQRRRHPDSRDPVRHREGVREDPGARSRGRRFSIVVVAEGARPVGGEMSLVERRGAGTVDRLGGIGSRVAQAITERTGKETRTLVLGHLQRGGSPTTFDRLLGLRFGAAAVRAVADGAFGTMVGLAGTTSPGCRWRSRGPAETCRSTATRRHGPRAGDQPWETEASRPTLLRRGRSHLPRRESPIPTAGWRMATPTSGPGPRPEALTEA